MPTASMPSAVTDWQPQPRGKAAEPWFFRIHCHHEQGFLPDSKNIQTTKNQMGISVYYSVLGAIVFPASFIGGWVSEQASVALSAIGGAVITVGLVWFLLLEPRQARSPVGRA